MNLIKRLFHVHDWFYYWNMSLFESKYNPGIYYYKCSKCGEARTSHQNPEIFNIQEGREL